jgi:hypothetical protein
MAHAVWTKDGCTACRDGNVSAGLVLVEAQIVQMALKVATITIAKISGSGRMLGLRWQDCGWLGSRAAVVRIGAVVIQAAAGVVSTTTTTASV